MLDEGITLDLVVSATDPDGDPINLTSSRLPPFATFIDNGDGTGTLTLAPGFEDAGFFPGATITASDATLSDSETLSITVNDVNRGPELSPIGDLSLGRPRAP